jgi:hypothetical protein
MGRPKKYFNEDDKPKSWGVKLTKADHELIKEFYKNPQQWINQCLLNLKRKKKRVEKEK